MPKVAIVLVSPLPKRPLWMMSLILVHFEVCPQVGAGWLCRAELWWGEKEGFLPGGSETASVGGEEAHVNAIGTGDMWNLMNLANPLFAGALKAFEADTFSRNPEHEEEFHRKWALYLRMLHDWVGGALPDAMVLGHLRLKLDEGNRAILDSDLAMNPSLSIMSFEKDFFEEMGRTPKQRTILIGVRSSSR